MKVLFIAASTVQSESFRLVSRELTKTCKSCEILALTLKEYTAEATSEYLTKIDIPSSDISEYPKKSPLKILRFLKPDILVVGNDSAVASRAFVEAANFLSIPTLLIQDGIIGEAPFSYKNLQRLRNYIPRLREFLKHYALLASTMREIRGNPLSDRTRRLFLSRGTPKDRIVVTGNPRLDAAYAYKMKEENIRESVIETLGIHRHARILLLLTQAYVEDAIWTAKQRESFILQALNSMLHIPNCSPVVKLHPRESFAAYHKLLSQLSLSNILLIQNEIPLYDLLATCDVAVSVSSTTVLEAMVFDKPVIVVNLFEGSDSMGYVASGAALCVEKAQDLPLAIQSILYDEQTKSKLSQHRKKFVYDNAYVIDGHASKRVAAVVIEMLKESGKSKDET
jgi:glycosyltransferase involved in cell wall biosynthesis